LVEHDLAKVGVASSNLVFRSNPFSAKKKGFIFEGLDTTKAQMVELVDTQDLKSCSRNGVRVRFPLSVQKHSQSASKALKSTI
jgi:hypothetical protein